MKDKMFAGYFLPPRSEAAKIEMKLSLSSWGYTIFAACS
jgi:hypothetical protein